MIQQEYSNSSKRSEKIEHVIILKVELNIIILVNIYMYVFFYLVIETLMNYLQRMLLKI